MTSKELNTPRQEMFVFKIKDFWSAVTHFIGFVMAIIGMPILLIKGAAYQAPFQSMLSYTIFMLSMILLYAASTSYHSFHVSDHVDLILKKIDHSAIFILIAGTYTPVCLIALKNSVGYILLAAIWAIALFGIIFKIFWVTCPKWVSSIMYTLMGWLCIVFMPRILEAISIQGFMWLLSGGIAYTIGAFIYALKPKIFHNESFGNHELFHCFVLLGSLCHFIFVFNYLTILH